jgi:plastocyanin
MTAARGPVALALALSLLTGLAACSGNTTGATLGGPSPATPRVATGGPSPAAPTTGPAAGARTPTAALTRVSIRNFAFSPATLSVRAGTTVVWTNEDSVTHTVTATDNSFNSGNLTPGQTYSRTFTTQGIFPYVCQIHTFMTGAVTVTAR